MAGNISTGSLDSLQFMLNDVIVQIGKALKASNQQPGRRNVAQVQSSLQSHVPHTVEKFHWTLDDLEGEILRAKDALQRDLDRFKAAPLPPAQEPHQVESQTKAPLAMDISSPAQSPSGTPQNQTSSSAAPPPSAPLKPQTEAPRQSPEPPMAPIPDMGLGTVPGPDRTDDGIKRESTPIAPQANMGPTSKDAHLTDQKPALDSEVAETQAPEAPMENLFGLGSAADGAGVNDSGAEFNFTDMTFDLAPATNESQGQTAAAQPPAIDMSGFGTGDDVVNLDSLLPAEDTANPAQPGVAATGADAGSQSQEKLGNQASGDLDDIFNLDGKSSDMDLSMGLDDGGDGSNFDDMFFGDLNMEETKFDDAFFGIEPS